MRLHSWLIAVFSTGVIFKSLITSLYTAKPLAALSTTVAAAVPFTLVTSLATFSEVRSETLTQSAAV